MQEAILWKSSSTGTRFSELDFRTLGTGFTSIRFWASCRTRKATGSPVPVRQSELWNWTYGTGLTELDFRTFGTGLTSISRQVAVEAGSQLFNPGDGMTKTPARHSLEHDSKIHPLMGSICERSMEREQKAQPGTPWNMTLRSTPFWGASAKGAWSADDAASSCGKAVANFNVFCIWPYVYIYIYIYLERERERETCLYLY